MSEQELQRRVAKLEEQAAQHQQILTNLLNLSTMMLNERSAELRAINEATQELIDDSKDSAAPGA